MRSPVVIRATAFRPGRVEVTGDYSLIRRDALAWRLALADLLGTAGRRDHGRTAAIALRRRIAIGRFRRLAAAPSRVVVERSGAMGLGVDWIGDRRCRGFRIGVDAFSPDLSRAPGNHRQQECTDEHRKHRLAVLPLSRVRRVLGYLFGLALRLVVRIRHHKNSLGVDRTNRGPLRKFQTFRRRAARLRKNLRNICRALRLETAIPLMETSMKIVLAPLLVCLTAFSAMAADDAAKQHATDFAAKAAMSNMFEIEAAKIEIASGKADDAKQFAQDMIRDHGKAGPVLNNAAKQDGIELPAALDAEYTSKLAALRQSDAANLDQAYLSTQVTAHEEAVNLFDRYSKQGPDGQLKRTAAKILPDLRMHLTRIRGLTLK